MTEYVEQIDGVEETNTVKQPETSDNAEESDTYHQELNNQKPTKDTKIKTDTEKVILKLPEFIQVRVTHGYDLLHPYLCRNHNIG